MSELFTPEGEECEPSAAPVVEVAKKDSKAAKKAAKVAVKKESKADSTEKGTKKDPETKAKRPRLGDDREEMKRLEKASRELEADQIANDKEREHIRKELQQLREQRRKSKQSKEDAEATAKKRADEEAQKKAEESAKRKAEYEEELRKAKESAEEYKKRQDKAERKAKKAAITARDEPEESVQKAKKVKKHEKAEKQAKEARSAALDAEYAYRRLKYYPDGNAPKEIMRIPLFEEKPPGWVQIANEQMAAWVKEQKRKKQLEESKLQEATVTTSSAEQTAPFHRLQAQRAIATETDPWSRPQVFWNQSWSKICELSSTKKGKKVTFYCGSQGCKKQFDNESSFWQHLNSKAGKRWCRDQPYIPVEDPEHPIPEEVVRQQRELRRTLEAGIRAARERTGAAVERAHGEDVAEQAHAEDDASTSDMIGSSDFEGASEDDSDEVIKEAEWYGLNVESLGPVDPLDAMEVPEVLDKESLRDFFQAKAEEKKVDAEKKKTKAEKKKTIAEKAKVEEKEDEQPAEESAEPLSEKAKLRRAGMTAFGSRMIDCTLDQVIAEIPGEMTGLEDGKDKPSPTSPAEGGGEHTSVVEESTVVPSGEVTMPIAAVTESSTAPVPEATPQVPEEQDRHLCQACQGSGQCSEDMNRAVMIILEAQAKALAEASPVSAVKKEKEGGESPAPDDDKRQGDFTVNLGMTSVDLIVISNFVAEEVQNCLRRQRG